MKILGMDTETTGFKPPIGVVEIGWVEIDNDYNILSEFGTIINPERPIEPGAAEVHGITEQVARGYPTLDEITFPEEEIIIFGHNINYDIRVAGHKFNIGAQLDTLQLARRCYPDAENHKLDNLAKVLELPDEEDHRAIGDVRKCIHLMKLVRDTFTGAETFMELYNNLRKPELLKVMPTGKYRGQATSSVPLQYWKWVLTKDFDSDMEFTAKHYLKRQR